MLGHFRVQPRVIQILGNQYRSSEEALKELVANAWDADATRVDIALPLALTGQPIVIRDNGCGMTEHELRAQYLEVAFDRRKAMGETTQRGRKVRGQLGIGKFGGFVLANRMTVATVARGIRCQLTLDREDLLTREQDLERVDLPILAEPSNDASGTTVELSLLKPGYEQPSPKKVGALLLHEFGVPDEFAVYIDEMRLTPDILDGTKVQLDLQVGGGPGGNDLARVEGAAWLLDKPREVADTGIVVRVNDRVVGSPSYFGLDNDPDVPRSLLRRIYGEVRADHLAEYVTASGGGIVENSTAYQEFHRAMGVWLRGQIQALAAKQEGETEDEFVRSYERQLELLPASRREQARHALVRIFQKLFAEAADKKHVVADLVLNFFEEDRYWLIARRLDEIAPGDLLRLSEVLRDWGLGDVADVASRARHRLRFLDAFEQLASAPETLELSGPHHVLETNAWLIGDQYELWASNKTMQRIVREYSDELYRSSNGRKRPDLLLVGLMDRYLLVELKRPSFEITRRDIAQAEEYRDGLQAHIRNGKFNILVLGGRVERNMPPDDRRDVRVSTYDELVLDARRRLNWLLENVADDGEAPAQRPLQL